MGNDDAGVSRLPVLDDMGIPGSDGEQGLGPRLEQPRQRATVVALTSHAGAR